MAVYELAGRVPAVASDAWVAESASVIGRVRLGAWSSVWYGAVLRGDNDDITIGARTSIQDNAVLHVDAGVPMLIGDGAVIGHQAMLHGCTIGDGSLIGIGSVILNHARIGRNCMVGAGSLVTEGKEFPDGVLIMGTPAKVVRELTPEQIAGLAWSAAHYVELAALHRSGLKRVDGRG